MTRVYEFTGEAFCYVGGVAVAFCVGFGSGWECGAGRVQLAMPGSLQTSKRTTGTAVTFTSLTASTRYYVSVHSNVGSVAQNYAGVYCTTSEALLPAPTNLRCSSTPTAIAFSWNAVANATSYQARLLDGLPGTVLAKRTTTALSVTFSALTPSTRYHVSVRSVRDNETQHWTGLFCYTSAAAIVPDDPTCGTLATGSIEVEWESETGVTNWFAARATDLGHTDGRQLAAATLSTTFTGLSPNAEYTFILWWWGAQSTSWTRVGTVSCATSPLPPPANLVCSNISSSSVTLGWDAVAGADSYSAKVQLATPGSEPTSQEGLTATSATFNNLGAGTRYWVSVLSVKDGRPQNFAGVNCSTTGLVPPANLACTAATDSITVGWDAVTGATAYRVSKNGGANWEGATGTNHTFSSLAAGTEYAIKAQAGKTTGTGQSATTTWGASASRACSTAAPPVAAAAPQSPVAHCGAATIASVSWTWDPVDGATGYEYRYQRSSSASGRWVSTTALTHSLSGLRAGLGSRFYLRAVNSAGQSAEDYHYCSTRPSATAPPTPGQPKPACAATATRIQYTWRPVLYAAYYEILHAGTSYRWTRLDDPDDTSDDTTTAFTLTGQRADTKPYFQVRAVNATGNSNDHRSQCRTLANPPTGLTVTCANNTEGAPVVTVSWSAVTGAERYQAVVRRLDTLPDGQPRPDTVNTSGSGVLSFTAPGWYGKAYQARVQVLTAAGWSELSEPVAATCPIAVACAVSEDSLLAIWSEKEGATRYRVSRGSTWVDATGTSHLFAGLVASTAYTIRVQAGDADGWGDIASKSCATTAPLLAAPASLVCTAVTATAVTLSWDAVTGAGGYTARISAGAQGVVTTANTSATFSSLAPVRDYYVSVHANKSGSPQHVSGTTCTTTDLLPAPASLACSATATSITLSWAAVAGATGYAAKVQLAEPGSTQTVQSTTTSSATFASLARSTDYYLSVHANKNSVPQRYSGLVCATTPPAPASIRCSVSASSMTVSWDEADGAAKYRVDYGTASDTTTDWEEAAGASHLIIGLEPSTAYTIKVQAGSSGGWGGTATTSCSTIAVPAVPATCSGLSGTNHCLDSADTITITPQPSGQSSANTARSTVTLKRIIASRSITATLPGGTTVVIARSGEKGGYAQKPENIRDRAWVKGHAQVYGDAIVSGDAMVLGSAQVYDRARVSGSAVVTDRARVSGSAWVHGSARVSGSAWVHGSAVVHGGSWISRNAEVAGNAIVNGSYTLVYGDARICGRNPDNPLLSRSCGQAKVGGSARVYEDAQVYGSAIVGAVDIFGEPVYFADQGPVIRGFAEVFGQARVLEQAEVYGNADVYESARLSGDAKVYGRGRVYGNDTVTIDGSRLGARIYSRARVHGNSKVYGNAQVGEPFKSPRAYPNPDADAEVFNRAEVYGNASVYGSAKIHGDAHIYGSARIYEEAQVFDDARVYESAKVYGNVRVFTYAHSEEAGPRDRDTELQPKLQKVFADNDPALKFWTDSYILNENYIIDFPLSVIENSFEDAEEEVYESWDFDTLGSNRPEDLRPTRVYGMGKVSDDARVWGGTWLSGSAYAMDNSRISGGSQIRLGVFCGTVWTNAQRRSAGGCAPREGNSAVMLACFGARTLGSVLDLSRITKTIIAGTCFLISTV